ncbi:RNA-dependent RNA polymerase family protein [Wolbachia pipientis]|uniref:hypothetical protein n=1 Tax=Wolbachia pipientis TaxID=955 RepID=UPI001C70B10E|nr:hypothetical protein [Wolbachia pipientis]
MLGMADDFLVGFAGPKNEAEQIKNEIAGFLNEELKLMLNEDKTFITHACDSKANFLGYEIMFCMQMTNMIIGHNDVLMVVLGYVYHII